MLNWSVLLPFHHFSILQRRLRWTWKARSSPMESWTVWAQPAPATWTITAASRAWPVMRATPPAASNLPSPPRAPPHQRDHHIPAKLACLPSVISIQPCLWNTHIQSHLRWLARTQLIVSPLCSQPFFLLFFAPRFPTHFRRRSSESSFSPLNFEPLRPTLTPGTQTQTANWFKSYFKRRSRDVDIILKFEATT